MLIAQRSARLLKVGAWALVKGQRRLETWAAAVYRRALQRVCFVGVTGSIGKTVTKDLIAAILETKGQGHKTVETKNGPHWVARSILSTRPWHSHCVVELGALGIDTLDAPVRLLRPQVAVITRVATDHWSAFQSLAATAREKGKLVDALTPDGVAVLNADDPNVRAMAARCAGRVVTYGLAADALVRADQISATWPDRLTFTVHYGGRSLPVQTRLCGTHWVPSVLAALATGIVLEVPLDRAVAAVATVEPPTGRLSPLTDSQGVTFLRDDWKASLETVPAALRLLAEARAPRKIAVIGTVSDYQGKGTERYVRIVQDALEAADEVVLVGASAARGLRVRYRRPDAALRAFSTAKQASDYLEEVLRSGDLVLLKSSSKDHVERIALRRTKGVVCWLTNCGRKGNCETCSQFRVPGGLVAIPSSRFDGQPEELEAVDRLIVGFGNPGERYRHTPHNVGQLVLDGLADRLGASWTVAGNTQLARVVIGDATAYLVKPAAKVNLTGAVVRDLAEQLGLGPSDCVLVHDDIDLPLGTVRTRLGGGAGGHNGVRSVIEAYQSQAIGRVKIGVGRPPRKEDVAQYVLSPLSADQRAVVDRACAEAADRLLDLAATKPSESAPSPRTERNGQASGTTPPCR